MPTIANRFVDTDVVGGAANGTSWADAFPSLDAWLAAETQRDLVALDRKLTVNYRSTPATARQGILNFGAGWVTDATRSVEIFVPPENRHAMSRGTGTYLRMINNGFGFPFTNQPAAITFNGLAVWITGTDRTAFELNNATRRAVNCAAFLQTGNSGAHGFLINNDGAAVNCIGVVDGPARAFARAAGTATVINCVGRTTINPAFSAAGMNAISCYGFSDGGVGFDAFGVKINCFSPDGTNGAAAMSLANAAFVSTVLGSEDLRLTPGSQMINLGQDNSANPFWIGPAEDAFGTPRPQGPAWDVGAHEWFEPGITQATIHAASHVTGTVATPNNALGPPDGVWTTDVNVNVSWTSRWRLTAVPDAEPVGTQTVILRVRKGSNSGNPSVTAVTLWEGGTQVATISGASATVTSTTGTDLQYTFDGAILNGLVDVDVQVATAGVGGSGSARNAVQIDAITANVQYAMPAPGVAADVAITSPAATVAAGASAAAGASVGITAPRGGFSVAVSMTAAAAATVHAPASGIAASVGASVQAAAALDSVAGQVAAQSGAAAGAQSGIEAPVAALAADTAAASGVAGAVLAPAATFAAQSAAQMAASAADVLAPVPVIRAASGAQAEVAVQATVLAPAGRIDGSAGAHAGTAAGIDAPGVSVSAQSAARAWAQAEVITPGADLAAIAAAAAAAAANLLSPPGSIAALAGLAGLDGAARINAILTLRWCDDPVVPLAWHVPMIGLAWTEPVIKLEWEEVA
ncbi:MAG: hypothetical protein CVT80_00310 [Alphaproteobacteria bacterium HGW-Alphaproteobacteria-2]|nr:MAG: hypothetical protein CVT80_00310 [Alphaproteobacteria bacterium HGW-Alphaproteobacteria-2]